LPLLSWQHKTLPFLCSVDHASRYIYVIKTNLMQYLSSVYFVNQPLHVSGIFVAHHQEVYCLYTTTGRYIEMHGQQNIKSSSAQQAKEMHQYKNIEVKLCKTRAAIWYNKNLRT
jgi:hypothetical protein